MNPEDIYGELVALCEYVHKQSYIALDKIRRNDFVFDNLDDRWQKLAFTLYTMLVEESDRAGSLLDRIEEESNEL